MKSIIIIAAAIALSSCGRMKSEEAQLFDAASYEYSHERYDSALSLLDTLRARYPDALELRRRAIALRQEIGRAQVEERIEQCRIASRDASRAYAKVQMEARDKGAAAGPDDARRLARARRLADSLRIVYDTEMAKMEYINKVRKQH